MSRRNDNAAALLSQAADLILASRTSHWHKQRSQILDSEDYWVHTLQFTGLLAKKAFATAIKYLLGLSSRLHHITGG